MFVARKEKRYLDALTRDGRREEFFESVENALSEGELTPQDFKIREVFEEFVEVWYGEYQRERAFLRRLLESMM